MITATQKKTTRMAIYTRKSTEEGLDQEFNSLDAQRQAGESYVASQRGAGWVAVPERYDDGGYSGANTHRPAFQRLMREIEAGKLAGIVVYRLDRLSRSVLDFVQLLAFFRERGIIFASVSEQFNTDTPIGRFTLNILMGIAQLERENIAERTRDKMAAARRRGLWTGGQPVLGYVLRQKKLIVSEVEAEQVRQVFRLYLDLSCLLRVAKEANNFGFRARSWKKSEGRPFDKHAVQRLLTNPIYIGKVRYRDEVFGGQHQSIIDKQTWDAVQDRLKENGAGCRARAVGKSGAFLLGLLRCTCGAGMTVHTARKGSRVYKSYVCLRYQKQGAAACPGSRVAVRELEGFVVERMREIGRDPRLLRETITAAKKELLERRPQLEREQRELAKNERKLAGERRNLLEAVAGNGSRSPGVFEKLGEVEVELERGTRRLGRVRAELAALRNAVVEEKDLRAALAAFDPARNELLPAEKARILRLLIEEVVYDAARDVVEITLRPSGVRVLAEGNEREIA